MYAWSIGLLAFLAVVSGYELRIIPFSLIFAAVACAAIDIGISGLYKKYKLRLPVSGIITGMIIGSVAPFNASLLLILVASLIAIFSKYFITLKHVNIFNPATLGLIVALPLFGASDAWWTSTSVSAYGLAVPIAAVLVIAAYESRRLRTALSFIAVFLVLTMAFGRALSLSAFETALLGLNCFFALLMLTEPKTSPNGGNAQIIYGVAVALMLFALAHSGIAYAYLIALLVGNVAYAVYRKRGRVLP
jgi:Na+-translocating ferredoxin:NAD+ oxidoreductase RnfD subunit